MSQVFWQVDILRIQEDIRASVLVFIKGENPFELAPEELADNGEDMAEATIFDPDSEFLLMPAGPVFIKYEGFRTAYEV